MADDLARKVEASIISSVRAAKSKALLLGIVVCVFIYSGVAFRLDVQGFSCKWDTEYPSGRRARSWVDEWGRGTWLSGVKTMAECAGGGMRNWNALAHPVGGNTKGRMNMQSEIVTLKQALEQLKGQKLTTVQFVHDYFQLGFEAAGLTAHRHPKLQVAGGKFGWIDPHFRHELCLLIETVVTATAANDDSVTIYFESGARLVLPIDESVGYTPESLQFKLEGNDTTWIA